MDVCAFVGVAPRGPARVPRLGDDAIDEGGRSIPEDVPTLAPERPRRRSVAVPVESFDAYRRLYGGFEGPGRLPYAVASFFEQGGRRAYIVRIVADYRDARDDAGAATGVLPGVTAAGDPALLQARDEGTWGNALTAGLTFATSPLAAEDVTTAGFKLAPRAGLTVGTLVRVSGVVDTLAGPRLFRGLRFVTDTRVVGRANASDRELVVTFEVPLTELDPAAVQAGTLVVETVEASLRIDDGGGRVEVHGALGLSAEHPRWLGRVVRDESLLVWPSADWEELDLIPDDDRLAAAPPPVDQFSGGEDRYPDIVPLDFFDAGWVPGDEEAGDGVHALVQLSDLALVAVPDLYEPDPLPAVESIISPVTLAGDVFAPCVSIPPPEAQAPQPPGLDGLALDPELPDDLDTIISLQQQLVDLCDVLRGPIALLDVPPRLRQRQILSWRARFRSAYAAAYHPWVAVARSDDPRSGLVRVNPSAVAAGIIARQEWLFGVQHGPANAIAAQVVLLDDAVSPPRHDELHQANVNVFLRDPDGIRLTAARTLSLEPDWRQLNVRRLMTMIGRAIEQRCQRLVFEPNDDALRDQTRRLLHGFLSGLFRANAFAGVTEEQSYFIDVDSMNDPLARDEGRFVVLVGVAPAEPTEFLVIRLVRDADHTLRVEAS